MLLVFYYSSPTYFRTVLNIQHLSNPFYHARRIELCLSGFYGLRVCQLFRYLCFVTCDHVLYIYAYWATDIF